MSAAVARHQPAARRGLARGQVLVLAALLGLAAVAWLISDLRMHGMDAGPGADPGAFGFYMTTWVVMMAAMMFPSIAPMVLTYRNLQAGRRVKGGETPAGTTTALVAGYLLVWTASGVLAYGSLKAGRTLGGGLLGWNRGGRWLVVSLLLAAAVYEVTPLKTVCLARCRSPLAFLIGSWRDGASGALRMGVRHGVWCLGCCWLLMVVLVALGAMSITWMILVTVLIGAEKLLPRPILATAGAAAVLAALAVGVAAAPSHVPGLNVPSEGHGMATAMRGATKQAR